MSKKFLFYIAKIYSINIIKPIVSYLNTTNHNYAYYISQKVFEKFPEEWDKDKILNSIADAKEYQSDFVLSPGNFVDHRIPGVKVQIFHGLGVEKPSHYAIRGFFDIYLTSGPYVTEKFNQLQKKHRNYFDVIETGWSKVDYILAYKPRIDDDKFTIPDNKKVILYAPTFSSKMQSATDLFEYIKDNIPDDEFWLIKFHELMPVEIVEAYKAIESSNLKIIDKKTDITLLLHLADIMLSDTSSVIYEFMVLNKAVITYRTIDRLEKGSNFTDAKDLRKYIDYAKSNSNDLTKEIKKQLELVNPYLDGKISENMIKKLENVDTNIYPKQNKPLNLIRKIKLYYHTFFKKGYLK